MRILLAKEGANDLFYDAFKDNPMVTSVQSCQTAAEAFAILKSAAAVFDIMVVDQDLPDSDGLALCQDLLCLNVPFPLVLLVAKGSEHLFGSAVSCGIESCLQMPTTAEQYSILPAALQEIVYRYDDRLATENAVEGLRQSHKRLQEIVAASRVPIFVIDNDHRITEWNRACEILTGLSADEMLGTQGAWRAFFREPKPTMADLIVDGLMETELAKHSGDGFRKSPFGEGFEAEDYFSALGNGGKWLFITAAPLRNCLGHLIGAVATLKDVTETRSAIESLEKATAWLTQVLESSTVPTFVIDKDHKLIHWNRACELLTGMSANQVIGTDHQWRAFYSRPRPVLADLIVDNVLEEEIAKYYTAGYRQALLGHGYEAECFFPALGEDGRWLFFTAAPLRAASGEIIGALETLQDVTDRRRAEVALAENQRRLLQIVQGSAVPTFVLDSDHRISEWNLACENLTGLSAEQMLGTRDQWRAFSPKQRPVLADLILDAASEEVIADQYGDKYRRSLLGEGFEVEDFFPELGEAGKWLFFTAAPMRDTSGKIIGAIETLQDVTRRRNAEDALRASEQHYRELSVTDGLTGLFNARCFYLRAAEEIDRAARYQSPLTLLMIDMDDFKIYNDTYGHPQGDLVLQRFADNIQNCLRRIDSVFRYGGEEFAALLPETSLEEATVTAERIREEFAAEIFTPIQGTSVSKTLSIGAAQWLPGEDVSSLLSRADKCLYQAKRSGKNRVVVQEPVSSQG